MKNIAVVFGGKSVEHDISIITGIQTILNLNVCYNIIPIYITKNGTWLTGEKLKNLKSFSDFSRKGLFECYFKPHSNFLNIKKMFIKKQKIDCAVLCLHGVNGEDGSVQGVLRLSEIPHTSSGIFGSAITMDKALLKLVLEKENIKTPKFMFFYACEFENNPKKIMDLITQKLGTKVVVKPDRAGSSIGVRKCESAEEIEKAINFAKFFDNKIIVEEEIENFREINLAVLGEKNNITFSSFEEVIKGESILSFDQKYISDQDTQRVLNIKLKKSVENKIKDYAKKAFYVCELSGVCRFDFFVREDEVFLNEINSIPGSMANYLFNGKTFQELLDELISISEQREKERENLTFSYKSDAISVFEKAENSIKTKMSQ